jgi:hypothetical protein
MKKLITLLIVGTIVWTTSLPCNAVVRVRGYYRKDGTYVQPHYRSNPDGNPYNNWSTYPNINPYTGKQGTKHIPNYTFGPVTKSPLYDDYWTVQKQADIERAKYWKQRGYNFDPNWMNAFLMDAKVKELSGRQTSLAIAELPETSSFGLVTGIIYSTDKPSALIGHEIVHEGDTINGAKVVKIHQGKIDFEKDGKMWTQGVGGTPTTYRK